MDINLPTHTFVPLLISTFFGVFSILVFYAHEKESKLIFGVLSAQGNFEARQMIRDTWKKEADFKDFPVFFIVGEKFCDIPILDRVCPYSCHYLQRTSVKSLPKDLSSSIIVKKLVNRVIYRGFTFKVNNKIVVDKIRIVNSFVKNIKYVKVHLIDETSKEKIASATFMPNREDISKSLLSKNIVPYLLPKNFEGTILMETEDTISRLDNCNEIEWSNGNGAISFIHLISPNQQMPIAFHSNSCSIVSMSFHLHDLNEFEQQIEMEASRITEWKKEIKLIQHKLLQESLEHNDILFVDVIDVYRNLPKKLLLFLQWLYKSKKFHHVVKSDDDSLLDVKEIEKGLAYVDPELPSIWAELRVDWAVRTTGKWREDRYRSLVYPPFPCGAGYALSRAVVRYLAYNADVLETGFQGEDVSVGIWLSALSVAQVHSTRRWSCDAACDHGSLSMAQTSPAMMAQAWTTWESCDNFCGCYDTT